MNILLLEARLFFENRREGGVGEGVGVYLGPKSGNVNHALSTNLRKFQFLK